MKRCEVVVGADVDSPLSCLFHAVPYSACQCHLFAPCTLHILYRRCCVDLHCHSAHRVVPLHQRVCQTVCCCRSFLISDVLFDFLAREWEVHVYFVELICLLHPHAPCSRACVGEYHCLWGLRVDQTAVPCDVDLVFQIAKSLGPQVDFFDHCRYSAFRQIPDCYLSVPIHSISLHYPTT